MSDGPQYMYVGMKHAGVGKDSDIRADPLTGVAVEVNVQAPGVTDKAEH